MSSLTELFTLSGLALILSMGLTSIARPLARRWNLVDIPDGRRKTHQGAIPLGGGLAVAAAFLLALGVFALFSSAFVAECQKNGRYLLGLSLSGTVICVVGILDDRFGLRGRQKLLGQILAVGVLLRVSGLSINKLGLFGTEFELGIIAIPFTVFWLLGAVNALNLMDGIDGLAATIGTAAAFAFAGMCLLGGRDIDAALAFALGGALIGFLRYNMPPASIYLGDAGSMLIGFLLGSLALHSSIKGPATVALTAPIAILAVPILDSLAAILRRKLTGKSIYATDRGHMHHVIMGKGYSNRATVAIIAVASLGTCGAALASVYWKNELLAGISVAVLIVVMVATRIFGYAEFLLLRNRLIELGRSLVRPRWREVTHRETAVQIQGSHDWAKLWTRLQELIEAHIVRVRLDLDLPRLQEGFHACWERAGNHDESLACQQVFPVIVNDHVIGRIEVVGLLGDVGARSAQAAASRLLYFVERETARMLGTNLPHRERERSSAVDERSSAVSSRPVLAVR
jgi:UDP-GlcNAc:undecaprenyl-phosphate/decaprenyl-phosphate GlcNAc-1-phosphate transferase